MIPRSNSARTLAALAYLPPVAAVLLCSSELREIKLVRQHCLQSLVLCALFLAGSLALAWGGMVLGVLPVVGYWLLTFSGLGITLWMLGLLTLAIAGAIAAYQGKYLRVRGLSRMVRALEARMGEGRAADPLQWEHDAPPRPRRPRGRPD